MTGVLQSARNRPPPRTRIVALVYLILGVVMFFVGGDDQAVAGAYFGAVAQVLPVIFLGFVVEQVATLSLAGRSIARMRRELERLDAAVTRPAERAAFDRERREFDANIEQLPERVLDAPTEMASACVAFSFGEAGALFALADGRLSLGLAIYAALALAGMVALFAGQLIARISLLGATANIELRGLLADSPANDG